MHDIHTHIGQFNQTKAEQKNFIFLQQLPSVTAKTALR